ncbi:MAG: site-specific integrase [Clostridia bacterium]
MPKAKKRLRAQVTVGHDLGGRPIYKWASGYTKKESAANKEELIKTYVGGIKVNRDVSFGEYANKWYETYKKPNIGESSQVNYRGALNGKLLPAFGDRQMKSITAMQLQEYMNSFSGKGDTTITYPFTVLKGVFRMAAAQGIIDRDPASALIRPKSCGESKRELTEAETSVTMQLIDTHPDGLLLAILYYLGVRRGEALGLTWADINFSEKIVHIVRDVDFVVADIGTCKSDYSVRDIPVPDALFSILQKKRGIGYLLRAPRSGQYWSQSTYVKHWKKIQAAYIMCDPSIESDESGKSVLTAHYFRHNYASLLYDAGVDVLTAQKYLGHSDPATTLRIYTHLGKRKKKDAVKKINKAFSR